MIKQDHEMSNVTEDSWQDGVEEGAGVQLQGHHQGTLWAGHSQRAQGNNGSWQSMSIIMSSSCQNFTNLAEL